MPVKKPKSKAREAKTLSSRTVFRGKVFHVTSDEVIEPGGARVKRDTVRHQGSVVVLVVDEGEREPRVLLARQYRYPVGRALWELPAGRIDEGEKPLQAARRELLEETGFTARKWELALVFYSSPGFLDEVMYLFVARELTPGKATPEEDERITKRMFPLSSALSMISSRKIVDGKTIAGLLWLDRQLSGSTRSARRA